MTEKNEIYCTLRNIYKKGQKEWYASPNDKEDYFVQMVDEISRVVLLTLTRKGTLNSEATKYIYEEFHENTD